MVRKDVSASQEKQTDTQQITADVIILGCSLPGIVAAHKLKKRFGDSVDVMVLDLKETGKARTSRLNVGFNVTPKDESDEITHYDVTPRQLLDNVARCYLAKYATEFKFPLPNAIYAPELVKTSPLHKVFQYGNGETVECSTDYHDFGYLSFLEKFELNQYQTLLDQDMRELFQMHHLETENERRLVDYDLMTMEKHICKALFFTTSKDIMRMTVRLVCGAPADTVSVLFYLHKCYRTSSTRNHLDGDNTRFREKLVGYCRKRLSHMLQKSVADITQAVKDVTEIRSSSDEVIVETVRGEATYVCHLLAMALSPDELHAIQVEDALVSEQDVDVVSQMVPGRAKKFIIKYEENFWSKQGYSGDIFSIRGPIIWAMERPKMSTTGSIARYQALVGYLMVRDSADNGDSKEAVLEQLVKLFGAEAAMPASYREVDIADVYVPSCGDYVAVRRLTELNRLNRRRLLEWSSLDIFAEGDLAAALEAGHTAFVHLVSCLRPQAQTYEDVATWPTFFCESPVSRWMSHFNILSGMRWSAYITATLIALRVLKALIKK